MIILISTSLLWQNAYEINSIVQLIIFFRQVSGGFGLSVLVIRTLPTRGETITVGLKTRNERFRGNSLSLNGLDCFESDFSTSFESACRDY